MTPRPKSRWRPEHANSFLDRAWHGLGAGAGESGRCAAAVAEAKKNSWRMAISIVGPAGELVYFEKMDGTQLASTDISQGKARTAVMFRLPSKAFADQYAAGNT